MAKKIYSEDENSTEVTRRNFISVSSALVAGTAIAGLYCSGEKKHETAADAKTIDPKTWWKDGRYIVHDTVDASKRNKKTISAKIDGSWRELKIGELPEMFVRWSLKERMMRLEKLAEVGFDPRDLDGPHNACVATYGGPGRDSAFSLNTAYKGMGFAPVKNRLAKTISDLKKAKDRIDRKYGNDFHGMMREKTRHLAALYSEKDLFDRTMQVSLELFTGPDYPTHTFLNMMVNPIASASFLAFPTFEIRAVPQLLHPDNPGLTAHEKGLVEYANVIHNFAHGGRSLFMACVYHVIELFNDTPGDEGMGKRVI